MDANRNACLLAFGSTHSAIHAACEGKYGREGVFYTLLAELWSKLQTSGTGQTVGAKLMLKFAVIANEKMHDLCNLKGEVGVQEGRRMNGVAGCSVYEVRSAYDLLVKLGEVFLQRGKVYPESILVIEGEVLKEEREGEEKEGGGEWHFSLWEWEKSVGRASGNPSNQNNNQSLLTLNMCIY
jgi:hypothetical protein